MTAASDDPEAADPGAGTAGRLGRDPTERGPSSTPTLVDAAVVLALAYLVGGVATAPVRAAFDGPLGDAAALATFGVMLALFAVAWSLLRRGVSGLRAVVGPRPTPTHLAVGVVAGTVAGLVLNVAVPPVLEILLERVGLEPPTVQEAARQALTDPASRAVATFGVVVTAPLGEELVFRGLAFRALRRHLRAGAALGASALLFAVLHTAGATWLGAVYLLATLGILAVALGLLVERQCHLWGAMVAHTAFNAVAVGVIWSV